MSLLNNSASFRSRRMKDLRQKMEGKTNFPRRLKQFDGLTWLTVTLSPILRQIYVTIRRSGLLPEAVAARCDRDDSCSISSCRRRRRTSSRRRQRERRAARRPSTGGRSTAPRRRRRGWARSAAGARRPTDWRASGQPPSPTGRCSEIDDPARHVSLRR